MSYTDFFFLVFLAVVYGLCRLCPRRMRSALLLVSSYLFYLTWSVRGALLMAIVTVLAFAAGKGVKSSKWIGTVTVVALVGYLLAFKIALLGPTHGIAGLVMPLGISYTTFKLISYVLDVQWGAMEAAGSFVDFAAYVIFFPQLLAGPIQRPDDYFAQLPAVPGRLADGLPRIAWGLVKKMLIADNLGPAVNYVYANVHGLHGAPLWVGFYLFPMQMYADFSGLTDIAIGMGRLLGITGPENFNRPYTASNIADFWRRWHMSLTTWLSDYVFTPLRMATRSAGQLGLAISITVNMIAIGLWHGLTMSFLAFGTLHAFFLVVDAFTSRWRTKFFKRHKEWDGAATWFGWLLTFHLVAIAMVFFRAAHVSDAVWLLGHLFSGLGSSKVLFDGMIDTVGARVFAAGLIGYAILELAERYRPDRWLERIPQEPRWVRWSQWSVAAIILLFGLALLLAHSGKPHSPFIYEVF